MIKEFNCEQDLSKYTDSMLFDSGEEIAHMIYEDGADRFELTLKVAGEVRVWYKDSLYRYPSEFPAELKELIKNEDWWEDNEDMEVDNNNWFETFFDHDNDELNIHCEDGFIYEADLSKDTPEGIKEYFLELIKEFI